MTATQQNKPPCLHRQDNPVRECLECGAYLTSANEDNYCSQHGGWTRQRMSAKEIQGARADFFKELMTG